MQRLAGEHDWRSAEDEESPVTEQWGSLPAGGGCHPEKGYGDRTMGYGNGPPNQPGHDGERRDVVGVHHSLPGGVQRGPRGISVETHDIDSGTPEPGEGAQTFVN